MQNIQKTKKVAKRHWHLSTRIGLSTDVDYFVENLAVLVASGIGIVASLTSIRAEIRSYRMKKAITALIEDVDSGVPFASALESLEIFPAHAISLIRVGEASGKLSQNLKVIAQQQEKDRIFKSKIQSAMMYPLFVLFVTLFIGVGIAWFILPKLATVFSQLHLKLPLITKVLIAAGTFLSEYGVIAVPLFIAVLVIVLYIVFGFSRTKWIGQNIILSTPIVGTLVKESEIARFGYLVSSLLDAGLPVVAALLAARDAADFPRYQRFYSYLYESIIDGNSFQKSFATYPKVRFFLPVPVQQLIISGEQSGSLREVLEKISAQYEEKTDTTAKNLSVILEPIMLVIVWLGVVSVALAVILPIYSLIGGLSDQTNPSSAPPAKVTLTATSTQTGATIAGTTATTTTVAATSSPSEPPRTVTSSTSISLTHGATSTPH